MPRHACLLDPASQQALVISRSAIPKVIDEQLRDINRLVKWQAGAASQWCIHYHTACSWSLRGKLSCDAAHRRLLGALQESVSHQTQQLQSVKRGCQVTESQLLA